METNFQLRDGIYIVQSDFILDLHNDYDFCEMHYSVEQRRVSLQWLRSDRATVPENNAKSVSLIFEEVQEFRFLPRDNEIPFTEDNCVSTIGYWLNQEWAEGVITLTEGQSPEPEWPMAVEFMSGAIIIVSAAHAAAVLGQDT